MECGTRYGQRYSTLTPNPFRTVLRELLQNAADASAQKIQIKFETIPSAKVPVPSATDASSLLKHTVLHHTLQRMVVTNDGQPFSAADWSRLRRIAEGNPDETKIGAFGVGFYSVFAETEEPFVQSGRGAMAFYWKGNSLFTRTLQLPESDGGKDTSFVLDYRSKSTPVPDLLSLSQFLATSLTFVGLETIELWLDDWNILTLSRKAAPCTALKLPREIETKTADGIFSITRVERQSVHMDARYMAIVGWKQTVGSVFSSVTSAFSSAEKTSSGPSIRNFFSRLTAGPSDSRASRVDRRREEKSSSQVSEDLDAISTISVFLHISTAHVKSSVTSSFSKELERATKKPPPKTTKLAILTSSYDETCAVSNSQSSKKNTISADVFASVLPARSGKIFIGFPTAQTTGILAHISAQSIIPTVERESIDLQARFIRNWNVELLRVAGIVCRVTWSSEMNDIKESLARLARSNTSDKIGDAEIKALLPAAIHVFRQFTSQESTPSSEIGQIIEEAFWTCNRKASIEVFSNRGILPSHEVRVATEDLSFVEGVPVLPDELVEDAKDFVTKIRGYGLVTGVTTSDIKKSLEDHALSETQVTEFLKWMGRKTRASELDTSSVKLLLSVAVGPSNDTGLLMLGTIQNFQNPSRIPVELPVPFDTIPFQYTKNIPNNDLEAIGWKEFQIVPWLRYLVENSSTRSILKENEDITSSAIFAGKVLPIVSKQWDSLSQSSKASVVELFRSHTVLPTKLGMRRPEEAYFSSVKVFPDLPLVVLNGVKEKLLAALGVRKTVELGLVFERLSTVPGMSSKGPQSQKDGQWSHVDLIKYLSSVRDDIPAQDIKRLRETPLCPVDGDGDKLFKASELYEPKDSLRTLRLPILRWPGVYRSGSAEGKFLQLIGLQPYPTLQTLISMMSNAFRSGDQALWNQIFTYSIANYHINGYTTAEMVATGTPFLPLETERKLSRPTDCFLNDRTGVLGFHVLRKDLQPHASMLGVKSDPPIAVCIDRLFEVPPKTRREAQDVFGYFGSRLGEINSSHADRLSNGRIVPVQLSTQQSNGYPSEKRPGVRMISPSSCFLGDDSLYSAVFDFVDFGPEANAFLQRCGSKQEPTKMELARLSAKEPARVLSVFQSNEKYLELLRGIAGISATIKKDKLFWKELKQAPFLLACRELPATSRPNVPEKLASAADHDSDDFGEDRDNTIKEWSLARADQIVIVDDFFSYNLFKERLLSAPQEEQLEQFYQSLGSRSLSDMVEEEPKIGTIVTDQVPSQKLQKLVIERSRLFLHEYPYAEIKHNEKWLEKNLRVQTVRSISLRRTLKAQKWTHTEKRTAVVNHDAAHGWTLWVTAHGYDLFQVSQALVNLLLLRPKTHSTMIFEQILSTDLLRLKTKGYNVDRILKAKQQEARVAETLRQQQLEEEKQQIEERAKLWKVARAEANRSPTTPLSMPGAFGSDSPDRPVRSSKGVLSDDSDSQNSHINESQSGGQARKPKSMFSTLSKRLGINEGNQAAQQIKDMFGSGNYPSPQLSGNEQGPLQNQPNGGIPLPEKYSSRRPEEVTAPHQLQQTLLSGIKAARTHGESSVYSRPATQEIKEQSSYCDERPGHDITFAAESPHGIKIFLSRDMTDRSAFLIAHRAGLGEFSAILLDCASVYALHPQSIHIFYDETGSTIAFNRQGSLFCNFRFFEQLHLRSLLDQKPSLRSKNRVDALVYWWVVLAHELAHNLVAAHSAEHSYYT